MNSLTLGIVMYFCGNGLQQPCDSSREAFLQQTGLKQTIRDVPNLLDKEIKYPLGTLFFVGRTAQRQQVRYRIKENFVADSIEMNYNNREEAGSVQFLWRID